MKSFVITLLKFVLAGGLIAWLLASDDLSFSTFGALRERWPWFLAGVASFGVVLWLAAVRWKILLGAQGLSYGWVESCRLTMVGHFFNQFMPGSTGGDVVKAYYVATDFPEKRGTGIVAVVFDRALGLGVLILVAAVVAWIELDFVRADSVLSALALVVALVSAGLIVASIVFFTGSLRRLERFAPLLAGLPFASARASLWRTVTSYHRSAGAIGVSVAISVVLHLAVSLSHVCLFRALSTAHVPLAPFWLLVPLAQIAMAIPITPGGLGTAEAAYSQLFQKIGVSTGSELCLLFRVVLLAWALVGAVVYLSARRKYRIETAETVEEDRAPEVRETAEARP